MEADAPRAPWGFGGSVWGLIGGLLLVVIVPPLLVLPFDPDLADPDKASDAAILATQALFDLFLILVAVGIASGGRFRLREALPLLGLRRFRPSAIGWTFAVLGAYYAGAIAFSAIVLQPEQEDIGKELGVCNPGIGIAIAVALRQPAGDHRRAGLAQHWAITTLSAIALLIKWASMHGKIEPVLL